MILDRLVGLTARNGLTPDDARAMMAALGIDADLGEEFPCVLPGYEGTLASVIDPATLRYETLYEGAARHWLSLAEVCAARVAGRIVDLSAKGNRANVLHARWWDRLRYSAGLLDVDVPHLPLPAQASTAARRTAEGFALLHALNALHHGPGAGVAFSQRFAADWTGLPIRAVRSAISELLAAGAIVRVGEAPLTSGYQPCAVYRPAAVQVTPSTTAIPEATPAQA